MSRNRRAALAALALFACLACAFVAAPLADLAGFWSPRTYLILAQNEDELRPTGGFISGLAVVTLSRGRVTDFRLGDSSSVDDLRQVYPSPPDPLLRYMGSQMWLLRDANWSPDFPASARQAATLYELGQGGHVDGVVAFDEAALQSVLAVLGPVAVPGLPEPVSDANFLTQLRAAWSAASGTADAAAWRTQRKDFMGPLARALLARLKLVRDPGTVLALLAAARAALDQHRVLLYLPGSPLAGLLARAGWDGAVNPGTQDYLRVVDANVGFNKVNAAVEESLTYHVDLTNPAQPAAILTVTYTNTVTTPRTCVHFGVANHSTQYADYLQDCYWDYWRVLLPAGVGDVSAPPNAVPASELLSGQADFNPAQITAGVAGATEVAGLFVLPTGQGHATQLAYPLPASVLVRRSGSAVYRLSVQKQPGTQALPLEVMVVFPAAWTLQSSSEPTAASAPGQVSFSASLRTDRQFEIVFLTR